MAEPRQEGTKCRKCGGLDFKIYEDGSGYCLTCNDSFANFSEYGKFPAYAPEPISAEPNTQQNWRPTPRREFPVEKVVAVVIVLLLVFASFALYSIRERNSLPVSIHEVSDLRGLEVLSEPSVSYITMEELAGLVNESMADWEMLNETRVFNSLFLLEPDENLEEIYESYMATGISGYYVPEGDVMVIIERNGVPEAVEKLTLAHEFTHALQDQHYDLRANFLGGYGWDQDLARRALIEGDASFLEYQYYDTLPYDEQYAIYDYALGLEYDETNYAMDQMLGFPYSNGYTFVEKLHYVGGWSKVNAAYSDPPSTTEHIMHPEKYLAGEVALDVRLSNQAPEMTLCVNETLGEFMVFTMLGFHLPEESALSAAEGWGGDRFHYYQSNGDFLCVWKIEWDTEADCQEFTVAFNKMVSLLPQGQRDEFTSGHARMDSDGTGATFYRASDPALISAILP